MLNALKNYWFKSGIIWLSEPPIRFTKNPRLDLFQNQALVGHQIVEIQEDHRAVWEEFDEDYPGSHFPLAQVWKTKKVAPDTDDDTYYYWRIQVTDDPTFECQAISEDDYLRAIYPYIRVAWHHGQADQDLLDRLTKMGFVRDAEEGNQIPETSSSVRVRGTAHQIAYLKVYCGGYQGDYLGAPYLQVTHEEPPSLGGVRGIQ